MVSSHIPGFNPTISSYLRKADTASSGADNGSEWISNPELGEHCLQTKITPISLGLLVSADLKIKATSL